jgi:heme/copper-type cytochrome/quinol oxidase subunit 3
MKHAVAEVGTGLQAAHAANEAREGLAIGLWSFLGAELLLFFAALLGGAMGVNAARRHVRRRAVTAVTAVPVADTGPIVSRVDLPAT